MPPALRRSPATAASERAARRSHRTARGHRPARLAIIAAMVLTGSLLLAPAALANLLMPKSGGSPNADQIHSLYQAIFYLAAVVFVGVEGALLYAVFKFRASKGAVAAQIHGNTRLEIGWTVGAALIVIAITVVTFVKLPGILNPPATGADGLQVASLNPPVPPSGHALVICVTGRQFIWRYTYGTGCNQAAWERRLPYSYQKMVAPANTTVRLVIQSTDVIHSWWVPKLGGKVDAVPGYTTYTWFKAPRPALYYGQCAQLCGRQHAFMTALVRIVTPAQYLEWVARQKALIKAANDQVAQLRVELIRAGDLATGGNF
jgi:cytochrome c oxidase subunit II